MEDHLHRLARREETPVEFVGETSTQWAKLSRRLCSRYSYQRDAAADVMQVMLLSVMTNIDRWEESKGRLYPFVMVRAWSEGRREALRCSSWSVETGFFRMCYFGEIIVADTRSVEQIEMMLEMRAMMRLASAKDRSLVERLIVARDLGYAIESLATSFDDRVELGLENDRIKIRGAIVRAAKRVLENGREHGND